MAEHKTPGLTWRPPKEVDLIPTEIPGLAGGDGALVELNAKTGHIDEYWPPTAPSPLTDFYEAMPDKMAKCGAGVFARTANGETGSQDGTMDRL